LPGADAATLAALTKTQLPDATPAKLADEVQAALDLVINSRPETEIAAALARVQPATLARSLTDALNAALAFDTGTKAINQAVDRGEATLVKGDKIIFRGFAAARLRYTAARYETEARLNLGVAGIYELQVRQSNYSADKHRARSSKFFFGMLAAQLAVIVSTFAIAARQRSFLWSIAAAAGTAAVAFSLYVFLYV
jgi:nucleoid DNA-binding protein